MSKEAPKVAVVSPYPLSRGTPDGVKDYIRTLKPAVQRKGVEYVLIGPSIKDKESNFADYELGFAVPVGKAAGMKGTSYKGTTTVNFVRARKIINSEKPDIIEFHDPLAAPVTLETVSLAAANISQIFQNHAQTEELTPGQKKLAFLAHKSGYVRHVMKRVSERHAVSPDTKAFWASLLKESEELYEVIPNLIDTERFRYDEEKKDENREGKLIIFTARHDEHKRGDILILAVDRLVRSEIRDFIVKYTGEGKMTLELKGLVKRLGLSEFVKFTGTLPEEEFVDINARADLLVACSDGGEGSNRSISNARASGTLAAATRVRGQTFAYGPEETFGPMVEPNNPDDLAERMYEFGWKLSPEEKKRRRELGRKFVEENFSTEVVASKKVAAYERVIYKKAA